MELVQQRKEGKKEGKWQLVGMMQEEGSR
jgi:hypothetical protein